MSMDRSAAHEKKRRTWKCFIGPSGGESERKIHRQVRRERRAELTWRFLICLEILSATSACSAVKGFEPDHFFPSRRRLHRRRESFSDRWSVRDRERRARHAHGGDRQGRSALAGLPAHLQSKLRQGESHVDAETSPTWKE